jgi:hypothetical protein
MAAAERERRYAKEIALACGYVDPMRQHKISARAAIAVADAEQAEADECGLQAEGKFLAEIDELRAEVTRLTLALGNAKGASKHNAVMATSEARRADAAEAAIQRVREIHEPIDAMNYGGRAPHQTRVCAGCGTDNGNWQIYPCPTVRALGVAN